MLHGDGTGRFGRRITVPAAEAADDPGSPGKAVGRMRVLEPFALSLEIVVEGGERCDLSGIEGKPNGLMAASVASITAAYPGDQDAILGMASCPT